MSWNGLANNQTVSQSNLKDAVDTGVFAAGASGSVTGNRELTKQEAMNRAKVDGSYAPLAAKSSNQLVVKGDLLGTVEFSVDSSNSLDISITDVTVNGVSLTHVSGSNFPVTAGNVGQFKTYEFGTHDIVVYYGSSISSQNVLITDSTPNSVCQTTNGGGNTFTSSNATITPGSPCSVVASDGACA